MTKSLFPEKEKARKALNIKAFRALQPGAKFQNHAKNSKTPLDKSDNPEYTS